MAERRSLLCYQSLRDLPLSNPAKTAKKKPKRDRLTRANRSPLPVVPPPDESQKKRARSPSKDGGAEKGPTRELSSRLALQPIDSTLVTEIWA